jgi:hypothetical protein
LTEVTTQEQISPMNQTKTTLARSVVPRPTTGWLRLRPTLRGRGFVVGSVDAAGPDTNGFAPRDRVAWRDDGGELDDLVLMPQNDVLGVPSWITDDQVVSYLGAGLIARALVRERPFVRGDEVRVVSTDPIVQEMTAAWAKSLGARVVSDGGRWAIKDEPRVRRTVLGTHGKLAQAAVEVFQAIRAGVFDGVRTLPVRGGRAAA